MWSLIRRFYRFLLHRTTSSYDSANWHKSTLVFSPHQDDETLGCGGTIIRKRQAGATVKIVFMTDGCKSHAHLIPEAELKQIRSREALSAAQVLGVAPENVIALNFTDGTLQEQQAAAVKMVASILATEQPEEIFVPHRQEPPADHFVTNQIVYQALEHLGQAATVYEYPIWFWDQYPWTHMILSNQRTWKKLGISLLSGLGTNLLRQLNCSVEIQDILELKRQALNQHRSQMQPLIENTAWMTLGDLSNGEFIDCFFQDREFFQVVQKRKS